MNFRCLVILESNTLSASLQIPLDFTRTLHKEQDAGNTASEIRESFRELFLAYHRPLLGYAYSILKDSDGADEAVQQVFCRIWERQQGKGFGHVTQAYLYKAVYHQSINQLKQAKARAGRIRPYEDIGEHPVAGEERPDTRRLEAKAAEVLNTLPEQCRTVFQLSRAEGLKYQEIADRLGISVKTVEAHMSKALRILRSRLSGLMSLFLFCIVNLKQ